MTKKDFILLADAFRFSRGYDGWEGARDAVANVLAASNPRFNRVRWLAYIAGECGPGEAFTASRISARAARDKSQSSAPADEHYKLHDA